MTFRVHPEVAAHCAVNLSRSFRKPAFNYVLKQKCLCFHAIFEACQDMLLKGPKISFKLRAYDSFQAQMITTDQKRAL